MNSENTPSCILRNEFHGQTGEQPRVRKLKKLDLIHASMERTSTVESISYPEALCTESFHRLLKQVGDRRMRKGIGITSASRGSKRVVSGTRDHRGGKGKPPRAGDPATPGTDVFTLRCPIR